MEQVSSHRSAPRVAVIGDGDALGDVTSRAEAVGAAVAQNGGIVVCGGLGGVMEAACRGAWAHGGLTIGILPGVDVHQANRFVSVPIATGLGEGRNLLVVRNAGAVVAVGGRFGTLSEIAFALKAAIPVIAVDSWHLRPAGPISDPLIRMDDPSRAGELATLLASRLSTFGAPPLTYHLVPAGEWNAGDPEQPYRPVDFQRDGFIHCTDGGAELARTGNRHLRDDPRRYLALVLRRDRITSPIRYDVANSPYPHIYGPLNRDAILAVLPMPRDAAGAFLPLQFGDYVLP